MASQDCPVVQLKVSTDVHKFTNNLALTFLVVKGPNNLIGRHSLARLWPREFERFKQVTCKNYKILGNTEIKSTNCNQINKVEHNNANVNSVFNAAQQQNSSQDYSNVNSVSNVKSKAKSNVVESQTNPKSKPVKEFARKISPAKIKPREI